ncbi:MAG TPA: SDR family NAD(P)-dependent oxidoreductase [Campylobacterales bacterium]|nr:SDR family NAD(P)-dependent oxidoreductase [Campylobacterales bacterium]
MRVFITGIGSGLGEALAKEFVEADIEVYAVSKNLPKALKDKENLHFRQLNLFAFEKIERVLDELLKDISLDIAILNAGILGELKDMKDTSLHEIESIMNLNVWANKVILDFLTNKDIKQIVAISSGASISGSRGWNGYALSKATLNMLIKLYSNEMPKTHLISLAPGLINTPMMKHIVKFANEDKYPTVKRLKESYKMEPQDAARLLIDSFSKLLEFPSGSYIDIRDM